MPVPPPCVDGRKTDDIKRELFARLKSYLPELPEGKNDAGAALAAVVAALFEGSASRLNQVPDKNYLEFLNTIGVDVPSPAAARVPVTFALQKDAAGPVVVPAGTKVSAKAQNGETVVFETLRDFSATPAKLAKAYYAAQPDDRLYDVTGACDGKAPFSFGGEGEDDLQAHRLYVGHDYLLNLTQDATATVTVKLTGCNQNLDPRQLACSCFDGEQWHIIDNVGRAPDAGAGVNALLLEKDKTRVFAKSTVNDIESFWIQIEPRNKIPADSPLYGFAFSGIELTVGGASVRPECMFFNNVQLVDSQYFLPFGKCPRTNDAFYIASADVLTKKNGKVTATYTVDGNGLRNDQKSAVLSYEYWNGDGWFALPGAKLEKDPNSAKEKLTFDCPGDCLPVKLNGKEDCWIRIKIASGDYGREEYKPTAEGTGQPLLQGVAAPKIRGLTLDVDVPAVSPESGSASADGLRIMTRNNNCYEVFDQGAFPGGLRPFQRSGDENSALYLGFSGDLAQGVLAVFFDLEGGDEDVLPPPARWEYYSKETEGWRRLAADDETLSLSAAGLAALWIPGDAGQAGRFGEKLSWLRCGLPDSRGAVRLKGFYVNTVWASQRETIKNEILTLHNDIDSVAGRRDHYGAAYRFAKDPVLSCDIYVNEARTLSMQGREALLEEGKHKVIQIKNEDGAEEFWVRWTRIPSLLNSAPGDRHYEADFASGRVLFGNGVYGSVPPEKPGAVKADYLTGGGANGNVAAFAVKKLISAVQFVAGAVNPLSASGGYEAPAREEVTRRGPSLARHRNRAITAEDFSSLAAEYRGVAKVNCLPRYRRYESRCSGCVTLAVIPEGAQELPPGMARGLAEYLRERAPAALARSGNIYIVSPVYVAASVTARIVTENPYASPDLAVRAENLLRDYFDPVTGGPDGSGWRFGAAPHMPDVCRILEGMDGVDYLDGMTLTLSDGDNTFSAAAETVFPSCFCNPYNIICSGWHQVEVKVTG